MRWSYKTIHYELKKEGFLRDTFLDEGEVEQSLNEYGRAGWELVSVTETVDGLIAIFKQPLDIEPQFEDIPGKEQFFANDMEDIDNVDRVEDTGDKEELEELVTEEDIIEDDPQEEFFDDDGLNTIRIE